MSQHFYGAPRPCKDCQHFGKFVADGAAVWCLHGERVHALPETGCAYWTAREGKSPHQPKPMGANVRRST